MEKVIEWTKCKMAISALDKEKPVSDKMLAKVKELIVDEDSELWVILDKTQVSAKITDYDSALIINTVMKKNVENFVEKAGKIYNVKPLDVLRIMNEVEKAHPEFKKAVKAELTKNEK